MSFYCDEDECSGGTLLECTDTDDRSEWCEWSYVCPKCNTKYTRRQDRDQRGIVKSDTFEKDGDSEKKIKEKTETARVALGVPKKYRVVVTVPVTGYDQMKPLIVMAANEEDAKIKVGNIVDDLGVDINGQGYELELADVMQAGYDEWNYEITEEE